MSTPLSLRRSLTFRLCGGSPAVGQAMTEVVLDSMMSILLDEGRLILPTIGTLKIVETPATSGTTRYGKWSKPARRVVRFEPAPQLRKALADG